MVRPREGEEVVPDRVVLVVPLDHEPLLSLLGVVRQRAVSEPEADDRTFVVEGVDDPAGVERPEAEVPGEDRDRDPRLQRRRVGMGGEPAERERFPVAERVDGARESGPPFAELDAVVIHPVAGRRDRRGAAGGADLAIGERTAPLRGEEPGDLAAVGLGEKEHGGGGAYHGIHWTRMAAMSRFLWICLGGAAGTGARYLLSGWLLRAAGPGFPWGALAVHVIGSFLLGLIMQVSLTTGLVPPTLRLALATGVIGGFTTYSTFNYET